MEIDGLTILKAGYVATYGMVNGITNLCTVLTTQQSTLNGLNDAEICETVREAFKWLSTNIESVVCFAYGVLVSKLPQFECSARYLIDI